MNKRTVIPQDVRIQLLQEGKINYLQYVMNGENAEEFIEWCKDRHIEPSIDSAELYYEMCEIDMLEHQYINDEYDGVW